MAKKIVRLTESDMNRLVKKIVEVIEPSENPNEIIGDGDEVTGEPSANNIVCIQNALKKEEDIKGLLGTGGTNKDGVDGIYGNLTRSAVKKYQEK